MKVIVAVIKPSRLDAVLEAVTDAGASGLTVTEVRGYGRQRGKTEECSDQGAQNGAGRGHGASPYFRVGLESRE